VVDRGAMGSYGCRWRSTRGLSGLDLVWVRGKGNAAMGVR
jgi:hypothetical protein